MIGLGSTERHVPPKNMRITIVLLLALTVPLTAVLGHMRPFERLHVVMDDLENEVLRDGALHYWEQVDYDPQKRPHLVTTIAFTVSLP